MKLHNRFLPLAAGAALMLASAAPASAQLTNMPVVAQHFGAPATSIGAGWGTGLNDESGKFNAFGGVVNRSGERLSFGGGIGVVSVSDESEISAAGNVAYAATVGSTTVGIQGGVGWFSPGDVTVMSFPIGVSVAGSIDSGEATIVPWAMPRFNIVRSSGDTSTDFAGSAGLDFTFGGGFGAGVAFDAVFGDLTPIVFGLSGSYTLGS